MRNTWNLIILLLHTETELRLRHTELLLQPTERQLLRTELLLHPTELLVRLTLVRVQLILLLLRTFPANLTRDKECKIFRQTN